MGPDFATFDLQGKAFACIEECGFCCTMQPELSTKDVARLSDRLGGPVPVAVGEGRTYLRLQNACGACTLLKNRACSQYDLRPEHCRFFPFHVYFGDVTEAYVNGSCRGVAFREGGDLMPAFHESVTANVDPARWAREEAQGREVYARFRELAEAAGAWTDPAPLVAAARQDAARLFTTAGLEAASRAAGEDASAEEMAAEALIPFGNARAESRPYYLPADLRWLTFARDGEDALVAERLTEDGRLEPDGTRVTGLDAWVEPSPALADALGAVVADRLLPRAVFTGSVFAHVDDAEYEVTVEQALHARLAEIAADLTLRARLVTALDPSLADDPVRCADEAWRFYDTEFLDAPTIGGYL